MAASSGASVSSSPICSGNPYDNARAESFMKILKCEEVHLAPDATRHVKRGCIIRLEIPLVAP
jgi:hypothetical protein